MKHLLKLIFSLIFALSHNLYAQTDEDTIKALMIEKTENFYLIMNDENNNKALREEKVLAQIAPLFDFKLMSRLALQKKIWKGLTREQKVDFTKVFTSRVKASYLSKLSVFADAKVKIEKAILVKKKRIQVTALFASKVDTKKLIYKFYKTKKGTWLIYDISIVGVSFLQSYRVQYTSYLKEHTFDQLLERLHIKD